MLEQEQGSRVKEVDGVLVVLCLHIANVGAEERMSLEMGLPDELYEDTDPLQVQNARHVCMHRLEMVHPVLSMRRDDARSLTDWRRCGTSDEPHSSFPRRRTFRACGGPWLFPLRTLRRLMEMGGWGTLQMKEAK